MAGCVDLVDDKLDHMLWKASAASGRGWESGKLWLCHGVWMAPFGGKDVGSTPRHFCLWFPFGCENVKACSVAISEIERTRRTCQSDGNTTGQIESHFMSCAEKKGKTSMLLTMHSDFS